jgi:hypothetical protein
VNIRDGPALLSLIPAEMATIRVTEWKEYPIGKGIADTMVVLGFDWRPLDG